VRHSDYTHTCSPCRENGGKNEDTLLIKTKQQEQLIEREKCLLTSC